MNLTRCKRGHYYDGDKYVNCPHCARKDIAAKNTIRMSESVDSAETEQRRDPKETGKALKDAVLDAMEKKKESEVKQKSVRNIEKGQTFPVGVLVAIGGSFTGKIYVLETGYNYIGFKDNVIETAKEAETLQECLMVISYHEEKNMFILKPFDTEYPVQVGRMVLKDNLMLRSYDKIVMKEETMMFVPICGSHFTWGN